MSHPPEKRHRGANVHKPHPLHVKKLAEIEECRAWGAKRIGEMSDRDLFMAGIGLYAGDGGKRDGVVTFSNSNPELVRLFCRWLRQFFSVDETRLRLALYLHEGLDLHAANAHWREVTGIPGGQFHRPYRAVPEAGIRHNKHEFGCAHVRSACSRTQRKILGLLEALVS